MYNIELVRILKTHKELELNELKNNPSSSSIEIKELEDEIKTLEIYIIRYEIAKIIGYDNNESYKKINYIGIENEDFSKMNLTKEQLDELERLKSKLPTYNADLFKERLEMAKMLKLDEDKELQAVNYEGIENNNPNSMRFKLSIPEIAKFNDLRNKIIMYKKDNNYRNANINMLAKATVDKLISKLNSMAIDDYRTNKDDNLNELFRLLDLFEGEKSFPEINNYEFANDISKKYPTIKLKIAPKQILELIDYLNHNMEMNKETYNDYMRILVISINDLLQEETITSETNAIIDKINKSNYSLRIDINSRLSNDRINFKDRDIESLLNYLDKNYNKIEKEERDKMCSFLCSRLLSSIKDVDNADRINNLIAGVQNKEFRELLRNNLQKSESIIFSDQHESSYSSLIDDKIRQLEEKKKRYLSKKTGIEAFDIMYQTRAREIDQEIEKLKKLKLNYDDSYVINQLDEQYNSRSAKIIKIQKEIKELKKLKEDLKTEFQRRAIDKRIKKLEDNISNLKRSQVRIMGVQKKIMTPKLFIEMQKDLISRHFESRAEVLANYADDYEKMAEKEKSMNGMFSSIKAAFYEFKAGRYRSKSELNQAILGILSRPEAKITITGSNKKVIPKAAVQALRQQMSQQNVQQSQKAA